MNKKVLVIGPDFWGYSESVARAFESTGCNTEVINYWEDYPINFINRIKCGGMSKIGINYFIKKYNNEINTKILNVYKKIKPDIVFIIKGHKIFKDTLEKIKESKVVLWMMDSIYKVEQTYKNIDLFDYRFMFEKNDVEKLAQSKISSYFLPLALDETVYYPINNIKKTIDILFVGALYPERLELLKSIIIKFPDLNICIYGKYLEWRHTERYINYYLKNYRAYFENKNVHPSIVNELYARTKIAINIHNPQSQYGCNQRFFEILGSKSFQIVDENKFIKNKFVDGKHIVFFNNEKDLCNKIKYYLNNRVERNRIANYGYQEVIKNHTFKYRINEVLNIIYSM